MAPREARPRRPACWLAAVLLAGAALPRRSNPSAFAAGQLWRAGPCGGSRHLARGCPPEGRGAQTRQLGATVWAGSEGYQDVYRRFLDVARGQGVDAALCFAADSMPEVFCLNSKALERAAKFVAKKQPVEEGTASPELEDRAAAKAAVAAKPVEGASAPGGASGVDTAAMQVCRKCLRRQEKKGVDFDLPAALEALLDGDPNIRVEPSGCLKVCKRGPNVQVVRNVDTEPSVVDGMTDQEVADRCFQGVCDRSAAARAVDLTRRALGGSSAHAGGAASKAASQTGERSVAPADAVPAGGPVEASVPAPAPRLERERVRRNVEDRVARMTADLEMQEER